MHPTRRKESPQRSIKIPLTAGNIRNGHVYVRNYLWFFPKSAIRGQRIDQDDAHPCTLDLTGFGSVETEIDASKGIFRWRGWKKFFRQHGVSQGDHLVFARSNRDHFSVSVERALLEGMELSVDELESTRKTPRTTGKKPRRCNDLSGDEWLRYSVSVWSSIKKTPEEVALNHPALFPTTLCERLITMFLRRRGKHRVLDPFMGSGSTLLAARNLGKVGIGVELSESYVALAKRRLEEPTLFGGNAPPYEVFQGDARRLAEFVDSCSIDLCITSPPYWDILNQRRTADYKDIRHYGNLKDDLGTIDDYKLFLNELAEVFNEVQRALRPGAYCIVVVMDLRKKNRFYALHSDLSMRLTDVGFTYDDLIIWDRGSEYNNLRPLGYPSVFRINKIHEFILIFRKPPKLG